MASNQAEQTRTAEKVSLWELTLYFLKLGTFGFGGPIALAGYMQRDLEEDRKWITHEEYLDGMAIAQTYPGPLAAQLAIWIGFIRQGVLGATLVGTVFVLPSFHHGGGGGRRVCRFSGLAGDSSLVLWRRPGGYRDHHAVRLEAC